MQAAWIVLAGLTFASARPAFAETPSEPALNHASRCYAQVDLRCVVQVLEHTTFTAPAEQDEALRLLAFAYARLDRHAESRATFVKWLAQPTPHRLDRATTPSPVFEDYAAAQLAVRESEMDLQPQLPVPVAPPAAVTPADLPRFLPIARSSRDAADDFAFRVGGSTAMHWRDVLLLGLDLELQWDVAETGQFGLRLGATRASDFGYTTGRPILLLAPVVRGGKVVAGNRRTGLDAFAGVGALFEQGGLAFLPAFQAGLRYHAGATAGPFGWFVELAATELMDTGFITLPTLAFGLEFRPVRKPPGAK